MRQKISASLSYLLSDENTTFVMFGRQLLRFTTCQGDKVTANRTAPASRSIEDWVSATLLSHEGGSWATAPLAQVRQNVLKGKVEARALGLLR